MRDEGAKTVCSVCFEAIDLEGMVSWCGREEPKGFVHISPCHVTCAAGANGWKWRSNFRPVVDPTVTIKLEVQQSE